MLRKSHLKRYFVKLPRRIYQSVRVACLVEAAAERDICLQNWKWSLTLRLHSLEGYADARGVATVSHDEKSESTPYVTLQEAWGWRISAQCIPRQAEFARQQTKHGK